MKSGSKWKLKDLYVIPEDVSEDYQKLAYEQSNRSMVVFSIIIILIELFNIFRLDLLGLVESLETVTVDAVYFYAYVALLGVNVVFLILRAIMKKPKVINVLFAINCFLCLFWSVSISYIDFILENNESAGIMITACLLYAGIAKHKPHVFAGILYSNVLIYMLLLFPHLPHEENVNFLIAVIGASIIKVAQYLSFIDNIRQKHVLQSCTKKLDTMESNLRENQVFYNLVMEHTNDILFQYNHETNEIQFSKNVAGVYKSDTTYQNVLEWIRTAMFIHEVDKKMFMDQILDTANQNEKIETNIRLLEDKGKYVWYHVTCVRKLDAEGNLNNIIGVLNNVDKQEKMRKDTLLKSRRDSLTGAYTIAALKEKYHYAVSDIMDEQLIAVIMLNLREFETTNETYGHLYGDLVLKEFVDTLHAIFRNTDTIARISGDEFVVLLPKISDTKILEKKVAQIQETLKELSISDYNIFISVDIGIAVTDDKYETFESMYRKAKEALYYSKDKEQNNFSIYSDVIE